MSFAPIADIFIYGMIALVIMINTIYGIGLLIRWIWRKLRKGK